MKKITIVYVGIFVAVSASLLLFTKPGNQVIGSVLMSMTNMEQNIKNEELRSVGDFINVDANINVKGIDLQLKDLMSNKMVVIPIVKNCPYCYETLQILANEQGIKVLAIGMDGHQIDLPAPLNTNMVIANSTQSAEAFNMPVKYSPTLFFVNNGGEIQRKIIGFRPNIASIIRNI